jgi:arylsulfatase A-like enzyme
MKKIISWKTFTVAVVAVLGLCIVCPIAFAAKDKPNILVIWGDDVGYWNVSAYNQGMMGYQTPNIDSVAKEGALFTDWYAQQSCTAGRAAFILGQHPFRTGLLTIGMPGSSHGIGDGMVTLATLLKPHGYTSGQFGKNHLGDRDQHLPTVHGFDEFFGNLYHLNAEEEPEGYYYPKDKEFRKQFGPRGVLHSWADGKGGQKIKDTGPMTKKRMETADTEFVDAAIDFIDRAHKAKKPFFTWLTTTRMHVWTHLSKEWEGKSGIGLYPDGMLEHDHDVGRILAKLKELGIDKNTIIFYSTDNGAETFTWPDGGTIPFHGEKGTTWEGGFRVPAFIKWPGVIKPGTKLNGIASHEDMIPTLLAAVGEPDIKEKLKKGLKIDGKTYKVHLDGYNLLPWFKGEVKDSPRKEIMYFDQAGNLNAIRYNNWKVHFAILKGNIASAVREQPAWPKLINLRADPFERGWHESEMYLRWMAENMWIFVPAQVFTRQWLESFKEFPPRGGTTLGIDGVIKQLENPASRQ